MAPLLEIANLTVEFPTALGPFKAVDGVDLAVEHGRGAWRSSARSGSGKSVAMLAVMGLLPWTARVTADRLRLRRARPAAAQPRASAGESIGKDMAMIFQEPMTSLNPCFTVGFQLTEAHARCTRAARAPSAARARARAARHGRHPVAGSSGSAPSRTSSRAA